MILGYSTNAFVKHPLLDAVDAIARIGFKGIEIACKPPHFSPLDSEDGDPGALRSRIERGGLDLTNLNSLTLFSDTDNHLPAWIRSPEERRRVRIHHTLKSLRLAASLGCRNVSIPSGSPLRGASRKETAARFRQGLEPVLPLAEELGLAVLLEPEPDFLAENGADLGTLIRELASPAVGLNFDAGHFFCAGQNPARAFEDLFEWIGHVHLEDIAADRSHRHLIPGRGAIDFGDLFRAVARLGYNGDMCLELYTYTDSPVEAGRESLRHLLPILEAAGLDAGLQSWIRKLPGSQV